VLPHHWAKSHRWTGLGRHPRSRPFLGEQKNIEALQVAHRMPRNYAKIFREAVTVM
jgi:hypothetical protein